MPHRKKTEDSHQFQRVRLNPRIIFFQAFTLAIQQTFYYGVIVEASSISSKLTEALKTYDKRVRPFHNGPRVNVSVQFGVIGLGPVDEKSLTLGLDFYLRHWWRDERLNFGNEVFNFNGNPSDQIWVPDTFFPNAVETTHHKTLTENTRTKLGPNGTIYLSTRLTLKTFCKMNLSYYPFDKQMCNVQIESYSYTGKEVFLSWKSNSPSIEYFPENVQLSGYDLIDIRGVTKDLYYDNGEMFRTLIGEVKVKRTFTYHLFSGYMPSSLLVILTWATFWIPPKAVPARVTLVVTNFLSTVFIIQQEGLKIIRVDYTTAIQIFLMTNLVFVMLSMVEYLIVLNIRMKPKERKLTVIANGLAQTIANKDEKDDNIPEKEIEKPKKKFDIEDAHIVDYYCRVGVPIFYAIFIAVYLGYFATKA